MNDDIHQGVLISIIDDDESARNAIARLVRSLGYLACSFASAQEFLGSEQLSETRCVISDIQMPEVNGIELQERLAKLRYGTPIIFLTAFHDDRLRLTALSRGATCVLQKPFESEALARCLRAALKA
jgi:FixJ family two-component response regulator